MTVLSKPNSERIRELNDGLRQSFRGEHDFGNFEIKGERFFFKLDYYNLEMDGGSEDPADPTKTTRVLTVMKAEEY